MTDFTAPLARLYDTVFDRAPDADGLAFWNGSLNQGFSFTVLADHFMRAPEFAATYGQPTNGAFVASLYLNILDRPGDAEGIRFWTEALDQGRAQRADTVVCFSDSAEHVARMEAPAAAPAPAAPQPPPVQAEPAPVPPVTGLAGSSPGVAQSLGHIESYGTAGNDTIQGSDQALFNRADNIIGFDGDDVLIGGRGNDLLAGGPGNDTFVFHAGDGSDRIADFQHGDRIRFDAGTHVEFAFTSAYGGGPLILNYNSMREGEGAITLSGLTQADGPWVHDAFLFG